MNINREKEMFQHEYTKACPQAVIVWRVQQTDEGGPFWHPEFHFPPNTKGIDLTAEWCGWIKRAALGGGKQFLYFEQTDGGMETLEIMGAHHLTGLYGWMQKDCFAKDVALCNWMETARVGEHYDHRLGVCVRVMDLVP